MSVVIVVIVVVVVVTDVVGASAASEKRVTARYVPGKVDSDVWIRPPRPLPHTTVPESQSSPTTERVT